MTVEQGPYSNDSVPTLVSGWEDLPCLFKKMVERRRLGYSVKNRDNKLIVARDRPTRGFGASRAIGPFLMYRACVPDVPFPRFPMYRVCVLDIPCPFPLYRVSAAQSALQGAL